MVATRIIPPRMPDNYGDTQSAGLVTDDSLNCGFQNGERYIQAPTNAAVPASRYKEQGVRMLLNNGQATPAGMGEYRAVFVKAQMLQTYLPNLALNQWSEAQAKGFGNWLWAALGPFGDVLGEAEEDGGPWRWHYDYAPQQYKWVLQGLKEMASQHPGVKIHSLAYASAITIEPNNTNRSQLTTAFQSSEAARALWDQFEWNFVQYYGAQLWQLIGPLVQAYILYDDNWRQYCMTRIRMELVRLALIGLVDDPSEIIMFVNMCVNYNNTYTEKWAVDLGNGATGYGYEFPGTNLGVQLGQAIMAFRRGKHLANWENPYLFGNDKQKLLPDLIRQDGFPLYSVSGPTAGRIRVPNFYTPAPPQPGVEYGYPNRPYGPHDLAHAAAIMHRDACLWAGTNPQPVGWRFAGGTAVMQTGASYWPDTIYERFPHVEMTIRNNRRTLEINDYWGDHASNGTTGVIEIPTGVGTWKSYEYWVNVPNMINIEI